MSLGNIVRIWGAANYKPELRFFDRMYGAAHAAENKFEHWWTDRINTVLHDYNRHECIRISSKRTAFELANSENIDTSVKQLSGLTVDILNKLHCKTLTRMGLKLTIYADLKLSFDELAEQLRSVCMDKENALLKLTSSEIKDLLVSVDYPWNDNTVKLRISCMNNEQGRGDLANVGEVSQMYSPIEKGGEILELYESIPNEFLYFDIDIFNEQEQGIENWPRFTTSAVTYMTSIFKDIKALILECKK